MLQRNQKASRLWFKRAAHRHALLALVCLEATRFIRCIHTGTPRPNFKTFLPPVSISDDVNQAFVLYFLIVCKFPRVFLLLI